MFQHKRHSLITIGIVSSIVIHFLIFIIVPSFGMAKPYDYTSHDISFLINELNSQKNGINHDVHELKSKPITAVNKDASGSLYEPAVVSKVMADKSDYASLNTGAGVMKSGLKKGSEPASEITSQHAREILKGIEDNYNKNDISGNLALRKTEKSYLEKVRGQIQSKYFIPEEAQRQNLKGRVTLKMKVSRKGKLMDVDVVKHSDFPVLDMAAIATVKAAAPFPDISDKIDLEYLIITVPFIYP